MDLSKLIDPVAGAIGEAQPRGGETLRLGVGDNAKAPVIAAVLRDARGPSLVIVPKQGRAGDLHEELAAWLGPDEARRLRLYPQRDVMPYERVAEDPWDVRSRLETTAALHSDGRPIVIAAVEGGGPAHAVAGSGTRSGLQVRLGDRLAPEELLRRLQATGYAIVPLVEAPGQAARRGGIVDVFPPQAAEPARLEFFGSQVESIRTFDVDTQRSKERVGDLDLGVANEFSPDPRLADALVHSLDYSNCDEEAERIMREELEALASGETLTGPSFLPALLSPYSLLDHLTAGRHRHPGRPDRPRARPGRIRRRDGDHASRARGARPAAHRPAAGAG